MHDPEHFIRVVSASVCRRSTPPTSDILLSLSLSPSLCVCMWTGHINHVEWKERLCTRIRAKETQAIQLEGIIIIF